MLLDRIHAIASQECGLQKSLPLLAGISGGGDSLCLLDILCRLGYPVMVAHFNHQLRAEAAGDADKVAAAAAARGARFILGTGDVAGYAAEKKLSIEAAARDLRYRFLFEQAVRWQAQAVVVGHTADDQVETVLMHLLRGAGPNGLKGMPFLTEDHGWGQNSVPLARPLLSTWRRETQDYCRENGLVPVEDITNGDPFYMRNRIRLELIPILEEYNPRFREALYRTATILTGDYQAIEQILDQHWSECVAKEGQGYLGLDRQALLAQPVGLQRGLIRRGMRHLYSILRDIDLETVERAVQFVAHPTASGRLRLGQGLRLVNEGERIYFLIGNAHLPTDDWPQVQSPVSVWLEPGDAISLAAGWRLEALIMDRPGEPLKPWVGQAAGSRLNYQAWVNADGMAFPLEIRPRRTGDRWQPLGMKTGSQKLSDFMINMKIPARARARWPIVCSGDRVLWMPGSPPAEPSRVTPDTHRVLHLRVWKD